jgi:tRNA(Ile)-lysidine synthase TilS/MesJ
MKYDCLLCLSGGKDSCSLAFKLKEQGYKVLAFTYDTGFLSDIAIQNVLKTVKILDLPHFMWRVESSLHGKIQQDYLDDPKQTMKDICTKCSSHIQGTAVAIAESMKIDKVVMGFTKQQQEANGGASPRTKVEIVNPYQDEYNLAEIEKLLNKHGIETDPVKTNCKFIKTIIKTDKKRTGENPFEREFKLLVRDGQLTKEQYDRLVKESEH